MRFRLLLLAAIGLQVCTAQTVPTPESVLGHKPGDDFYLANYQESRDYFRRLAAASNRIKLITVGKTTRGLDWEIANPSCWLTNSSRPKVIRISTPSWTT
jgi:hypothetical protein